MEENQKRTIGPVTRTTTGVGTLAGALTIIIVWFIGEFSGVEIPVEVGGAITVVFMAIGNLIGGLLVRPGTGERRA